jgi:uncharacterized protein (TIGR02001 family)
MHRGVVQTRLLDLIIGMTALVFPMQSRAQSAVPSDPEAAAAQEIEIALANDDRFGTRRRPEKDELAVDKAVFEVEATVSVVSDYRYRGVSLSNGKPAVQVGASVAHQSGLYASLWTSNVASNGGANAELDIAVGFTKELGGITAEIGTIDYIYPGVINSNYYELQSSLTGNVGPAEVNVGLAYAPHQDNLGGADNVYGSVGFEMPYGKTPLTLKGAVGLEDGAFGDRKVDWLLGANYNLKGIDVGVSYTDTARNFGAAHSGATALLSLGHKF